MKSKTIKLLTINIDKKLHRKLKEYCVKKGITMTDYIIGLVRKDMVKKTNKDEESEDNKKLRQSRTVEYKQAYIEKGEDRKDPNESWRSKNRKYH